MRRHFKRFSLSQAALVDAVMTSKSNFMDVFVKIRVWSFMLVAVACSINVTEDF